MKDKFLINFYRDGELSSQQRTLSSRKFAEEVAQRTVEAMREKGIAVTYEVIPQ